MSMLGSFQVSWAFSQSARIHPPMRLLGLLSSRGLSYRGDLCKIFVFFAYPGSRTMCSETVAIPTPKPPSPLMFPLWYIGIYHTILGIFWYIILYWVHFDVTGRGLGKTPDQIGTAERQQVCLQMELGVPEQVKQLRTGQVQIWIENKPNSILAGSP